MDSHAHLDFFREDRREELIARAASVGLKAILTVAVSLERVAVLQSIVEKYCGFVFHSVGVHPLELEEIEFDSFQQRMDEVLSTKGHRPVAVGETGLDYASLPKDAFKARSIVEKQRKFLIAQANVAKNANLPLIIHCRDADGESDAWNDMCAIMKELKINLEHVLIHCFSYGPMHASKWQADGGWLSFSGILTRKSAKSPQQALCSADMSMVLFETDSPFLLPEPIRSKDPKIENEPANVVHVFKLAAEMLDTSAEHIASLSLRNGCKFFSLDLAK
jgi:TatD DNase family protein